MGKIMKDGIQYGVGGIQKAESITYDNTDSGMTATDVQGALDELSTGFKLVTGSGSYTGGTGTYRDVNIDLTNSLDGYIPIALAGYELNSSDYFFIKFVINGNVMQTTIGSKSGSFDGGTGSINVTALCVSPSFNVL